MSPQRSAVLAVLVAALVAGGSACSATQTIASSDGDDAPAADATPPTIGLGSEIGTADGAGIDPAEVSGDAEARAVDAQAIDTIVMIGDSITVGSLPALEERFAGMGFGDVIIQAENGKRIAQEVTGNASGVSIAESLVSTGVAGDPSEELWVVALGTNDIGQYADESEVEGVVKEMLAVVPDGVALVWVDTYLPNDPDGAALINDAVRDRLAERGNAVVAEWSAVADREGVLSSDMIHPSEQGSEVFAATVAATVARFLDS